MNSEDFLACLGKSDESPEIVAMFAALGVQKKPKIPRGDIEARIDSWKGGLSLIFKPEGPKTSKLILVAVQMFSETTEGFKTFQGELPNKLLFSDMQTEARAKLGNPNDSSKSLRRDIWISEGSVLTVKYSKMNGQISMVSYHMPEYF